MTYCSTPGHLAQRYPNVYIPVDPFSYCVCLEEPLRSFNSINYFI